MLETVMMNSYVWLQTCDGSIQQVEQEITMISPFIREEISQKGTGSSKSSPICLPQQVSLALLSSILDYCRFHQIQGHSDKERKLYDAKFVRIDPNILFALAFAAKSLQLKPLINLTCHALERLIEGRSTKEICGMFVWPDDLTEEEKLESIMNKTNCDSKIRHLNLLNINRRKERERVLANVRVKQEEVPVEDERSIEELLSFINGSNDGETKGNKSCKNKKKNRKKKKDQEKNSSMKEEEDLVVDQALTAKIDEQVEKEGDPRVEFDDEIDREVEEFARRLNCTLEERIKETLTDCANHREIVA